MQEKIEEVCREVRLTNCPLVNALVYFTGNEFCPMLAFLLSDNVLHVRLNACTVLV